MFVCFVFFFFLWNQCLWRLAATWNAQGWLEVKLACCVWLYLADKYWKISCIKVRQSSLLPHIQKDLIFDFSPQETGLWGDVLRGRGGERGGDGVMRRYGKKNKSGFIIPSLSLFILISPALSEDFLCVGLQPTEICVLPASSASTRVCARTQYSALV